MAVDLRSKELQHETGHHPEGHAVAMVRMLVRRDRRVYPPRPGDTQLPTLRRLKFMDPCPKKRGGSRGVQHSPTTVLQAWRPFVR